jgi:hypothetical protein
MQARAHEYVKWVFTGYGNNLHFFCLLNYGLWQERNNQKHREGGRNVTSSIWWLLQTTMDLAQSDQEKPKRNPKKKVRWQPPNEGVLKINTDTSFHNYSMSVGLVVRDHLGTMIRSQALYGLNMLQVCC